jgi:hypothetical protein
METEKRFQSLIGRLYSAKLMNNTKWRKFFLTVARVLEAKAPWGAPWLTRCRWRPVGDKAPMREVQAPRENDILETYIRDGVWGVPVEYREIEWVEIPEEFEINKIRKATQNVSEVYEALTRVAQFPIERTQDGLRITGYVRAHDHHQL